MLQRNFCPGVNTEKKQLLFLAIGLSLISGGSWWILGARVFTAILVFLAAVALGGFLGYRSIGRDIFLVFSLLSLVIGWVVSWLVLLCLYVLPIGVFGSILRLFGMNRLERNFELCKGKDTMFVDVPSIDEASFRRQS